MNVGRIGITLAGSTPAQTLDWIVRAEALGIGTFWITQGAAAPDGLTLFAAAAKATETIRLGTSIIPSFPRHPLVLVQQAEVVANLAPGRLILGIGPSHPTIIEGGFGIPYERPLEHLHEYVGVVKAALQTGKVDFEGKRFRVHAAVPNPAPVPVMISALRPGSYRLAGAAADGAIAWISPAPYLRDVAAPALAQSARRANRQTPSLIAHCFVALSVDRREVQRVARERIGLYARLPFYQEMFAAAGYPEARKGEWTDSMIDAVVISGNEGAVAASILQFVQTAGADELIVSVLPVGTDVDEANERTARLVGNM